MPLVNRLPVDAAGKLLVTTTVPSATWPQLGGMTYDPTTGALAVIDAVPAANDPWVGGIRFTNLGSMYVWSAAMPAGVEFIGGIPVTDDGRVVVGTGTPIYGVGGWPIDASGGVSVGSGLAPVPIFFAPLTNSLVPTTAGNPAFTFTRATLAYAMDNEGVLRQSIANEARFQGARRVRNWVANSNNFATWGNVSATLTPGVTGPTGLADATTLTAAASNGQIYYGPTGVPSGAMCVNSMWVRRRTGTGPVVLRDSNNVNVVIVPDGTWRRFATSAVAVTSAFIVISCQFSGDAVDIAYAQFEQVDGQSNQAPGEYVSVGVLAAPYHGNAVDGVKYFATTNGNSVAGNVVTEAAGTAIPLATMLGYVAENAATNLLTYSQDFDNAGWAKFAATIAANTQAAPDGTLTADVFTDNATSTFHYMERASASLTSGTVYTVSVYLKAGTLTWMQVGVAIIGWANFNLVTGAVGFKSAGVTASIQALPNGWYRCVVTGPATVTAGGITQLQAKLADINADGQSYVGTGQTMYLWGAQVEQASDPSSYIPTTTAAVTRNVDVLQYSLATNIDGALATTYSEAYTPYQNGTAQQILLYWNTGAFQPAYYNAGKSLANYSGGVINTVNVRNVGAVNKNAVAWSGATTSLCLNGGAVAAGAFAPFTNSGNIVLAGSGSTLQGMLRNVKFYATRLTDAELQAMTT